MWWFRLKSCGVLRVILFFSRVCCGFVTGYFRSRRRGLISDAMCWDCSARQLDETIKEKESSESQLAGQLHLLLRLNVIVGWPRNRSAESEIHAEWTVFFSFAIVSNEPVPALWKQLFSFWMVLYLYRCRPVEVTLLLSALNLYIHCSLVCNQLVSVLTEARPSFVFVDNFGRWTIGNIQHKLKKPANLSLFQSQFFFFFARLTMWLSWEQVNAKVKL